MKTSEEAQRAKQLVRECFEENPAIRGRYAKAVPSSYMYEHERERKNRHNDMISKNNDLLDTKSIGAKGMVTKLQCNARSLLVGSVPPTTIVGSIEKTRRSFSTISRNTIRSQFLLQLFLLMICGAVSTRFVG